MPLDPLLTLFHRDVAQEYIDNLSLTGKRIHLELLLQDLVDRDDLEPSPIKPRTCDRRAETQSPPSPGPSASALANNARPSGPGHWKRDRTKRTEYTDEDDRILYLWVQNAKARGAKVSGTKIYKELEAVNDRHTYQSWRDHYMQKLRHMPPPQGLDSASSTLEASHMRRPLAARDVDVSAPSRSSRFGEQATTRGTKRTYGLDSDEEHDVEPRHKSKPLVYTLHE